MFSFLSRFGLLATILLLIGTVAFKRVVLPRARLPEMETALCGRVAARIGLFATLALIPLIGVRLMLQVHSLQMPGDSWTSIASPLLNATSWGRVWYLQLTFAFIAFFSFIGCVRGRYFAWKPAALASIILAATPAFSGHAMSAESSRALLVPADFVHVMGAGTWVGTLAVLIFAGVIPLRRTDGTEVNSSIASLVISFSPLAQASAALVVASGVVASWKHLQTIPALFFSTYGQILLLKVSVVAIVAALGFVNWKRVTPRIASEGPSSLVTSSSRELFAATAVLIVTAILIATPQPMMQ